jgi:3',5'-cyclic AMP phosphodiesterase CpdA
MTRLVHISDIHVTADTLGWRVRDYFNKRLTAWMNLRLIRRGVFADSERILASLADDLHERGSPHVVFSGDATSLGMESEISRAAELLAVGRSPGLAVPGNHDYLIRHSASAGAFERHFGAWQQGERLDGHIYPFAQRVGELWLVGVNSARSNRWMWDATGEVGIAQCRRLHELLTRLPPGPRVLVTHYPVCLANGAPERRVRGLVDLWPVLDTAAEGGVVLWLHGHRHSFYHLQEPPHVPFPIICVGSSTQAGHSSYGDYMIDQGELRGLRREFDPATGRFRDGPTFTLRLPM